MGKNCSHPNSNVRGYIGIEKNPNSIIEITKNTIPYEYRAPVITNKEAKLAPTHIKVRYLYNFVISIYKASIIEPFYFKLLKNYHLKI